MVRLHGFPLSPPTKKEKSPTHYALLRVLVVGGMSGAQASDAPFDFPGDA